MERETLREAWIRKQLSQTEAATIVGVGVATWRRWETGLVTIPQSEMGHIETINIMALSSLKGKDRDMEQTIDLFVMGIEGAKAFQSEQRFNEALDILRDMEIAWPDERRVIELHDLTKHW